MNNDLSSLQSLHQSLSQRGASVSSIGYYKDLLKDLRLLSERVVSGYTSFFENTNPSTNMELKASIERDYHQVDVWVRQANIDIISLISSAVTPITTIPPPSAQATVPLPRPRVSRLEKISLPMFTGNTQDWSEFRRLFVTLTSAEDYEDCFLVAQLKSRLPTEALELIRGMDAPQEIWDRLCERYGNREHAILQEKYKLHNVQLGGGPGHSQVEKLCQAVRAARTNLRAVQAEDYLFSDLATIGILSNKLPSNYQQRWHLEDNPSPGSTEGKGERFKRWLEREGKAATRAHLEKLSLDYHPKSSSSSSSKNQSNPLHSDSFVATGSGSYLTKVATKAGAEALKGEILVSDTVCPACKKNHSYERTFSWGKMDWPSRQLSSCPTFSDLGVKERAKMVEVQGGCPLCTSWMHSISRCWAAKAKAKATHACSEETTKGVCGKMHHPLLHSSGNAYCLAN